MKFLLGGAKWGIHRLLKERAQHGLLLRAQLGDAGDGGDVDHWGRFCDPFGSESGFFHECIFLVRTINGPKAAVHGHAVAWKVPIFVMELHLRP